MFAVKNPVWEMEPHEELHLYQLPEVVEFFRVRPEWTSVESEHVFEDHGVYYLSHARGLDGQKAMAHSGILAHLERVTVRGEFVLAVDLDRQTAQVASPVLVQA